MHTFTELGLRTELLDAITKLGYENPTPIQKLAIPEILGSKRDLIAYAQTGTGKTAAFSLPILNDLDPDNKNIQCIILSPTRELGIQITKDLESYSKKLERIKILAVYGGASIEQQMKVLKRGCHIVVGTPGRTLDLIRRGHLNLGSVKWLVLDEADEMLSMGFAEDMDEILATTPSEKQTLLFSATMPKEMVKMANKYMTDPAEVSAGSKKEANQNVHHVYYLIHQRDRYLALKRAVDINPDVYGIIFCRTRSETKNVAEKLAGDGYNTDALHGDLSQAQRDYVMNRFRNRQIQLLIATDVAARGLDVQDLTHVINYNLPDEDEVYVHRSGRTGRADKLGVSLVLVNPREQSRLRSIEKKIGRKFDRMPIPGGKEICENQLFHLIDNIVNNDIVDHSIDKFMPQVYDMFNQMSKEDLIRKVVAVEFNRFLEYYTDAPDLNNRVKEGDRRGDSRRSGGSADMTRFFMNKGKKDGLAPKSLMQMINEAMPGISVEIGKIEIMKMFSFFEVESKHARTLRDMIRGTKFKGKLVQIEESKPKKKGKGRRRR